MPFGYSENPWPSLEPGKLRHQVQIQQRSTTQDQYGQELETWTTILTKWARIEAAKESEIYQSGALTSRVTHTITVRWDSTQIAPGMRVLYTSSFGNHYYQIQNVTNIEERNVVAILDCLELDEAE